MRVDPEPKILLYLVPEERQSNLHDPVVTPRSVRCAGHARATAFGEPDERQSNLHDPVLTPRFKSLGEWPVRSVTWLCLVS